MKTQTKYQTFKTDLFSASVWAKEEYKTDKPSIRIIINSYLDRLCKETNLSKHQKYLLTNYALTLQP